MKIAIAVTSPEKDAHIDTRGARAPFYLVLNTESGRAEILPNPVADAERRAGPQAAAFLLEQGVAHVVAADFGPRFRTVLEENNITCTEMTGSASDAISKLSDNS